MAKIRITTYRNERKKEKAFKEFIQKRKPYSG